MGYVNSACRAVERDPSRLVLLGAEPYAPETQYGYILPGSEAKDSPCPGLHPVLRFIEKPGQHTARELLQWGSLWNTLVMVFQTRTMLNLVRRAVPVLYRAFERIEEALGTPQEKDILEETYRDTTPWNFSRGLLEMLPSLSSLSLSVLTLRGVFWSDWGSEARILSDLKKLGFTARLRELDARLQQSAMRPGDLHTEIGLHDKDDLACF